MSGEAAGLVAGFGALAGHIFPVWLKFKGGKGVATGIGLLFGIAWLLGLAALAVWLIMAFLFRTSSISALTASALTPLWAYLLGRSDLVIPLLVLAAIIWITHRGNIARVACRNRAQDRSRPKGMKQGPPTPAEKLAWIRLAMSENVGPASFRELLKAVWNGQRSPRCLARNFPARRDGANFAHLCSR